MPKMKREEFWSKLTVTCVDCVIHSICWKDGMKPMQGYEDLPCWERAKKFYEEETED